MFSGKKKLSLGFFKDREIELAMSDLKLQGVQNFWIVMINFVVHYNKRSFLFNSKRNCPIIGFGDFV